jgi:D-glycerate 3-kinase
VIPGLVNPLAAHLLPWCVRRLQRRRQRTFVLGLQGPQGCGKSTAAAALVESVRDAGSRAIAVSIDDFYLTHAEQRALAARHRGNPYVLHRGYPGTHDVALGARTLGALASASDAAPVHIPAYDKSAHAGRGDRAPELEWRRVTGPFDLVIVEGWMLGFTPVDEARLEPDLVPPNRYLAAYRAWNASLHAMVHLSVDSPETIVEWRVGSERARRERGEPALSDEDATDYIRRFLPAYRVYVPALATTPPCDDFLALVLRSNREPTAQP